MSRKFLVPITLPGSVDLTETSRGHPFQIGDESSSHLVMDADEIMVRGGFDYLNPGTTGYVVTPDAADLNVTGNIRFTARVRDDSVEGASARQLVYKVANNQLAYTSLSTYLTAQYGLITWADAAGTGQATSAVLRTAMGTTPPGTEVFIGSAITNVGGTGNLSVQLLRSLDGITWTNVGAPLANNPQGQIERDTTANLSIGVAFQGRIIWVQAESLDASGNPTGLIWRFDASDYPGAGTTWVDPRGRTWSLGGDASIVAAPATTLQLQANGSPTSVGGPLLLPADPTAALQAATKQYVDKMDEVAISPTDPIAANPNAVLWYDSDAGSVPVVSPQFTLYTVPGTYTWTKPPGATRVKFEGIGAGAGGGSGRRGAALSVRCGGGGGGSGPYSWQEYAASDLPASCTVSIGAGGAGGAAITADNTDGAPGVTGIVTYIRDAATGLTYYLDVRPAVFGAGGTALTGTGGAAQGGMMNGAAGGTASVTGGAGGTGGSATTGAGGSGGGITSGDVPAAGGSHGQAYGRVDRHTVAVGAVNSPGNTPTAPATTSSLFFGSGGSGGGASVTVPAGKGGDGQAAGGGGAGGGASLNGFASGAGGKGADAAVMITTYF